MTSATAENRREAVRRSGRRDSGFVLYLHTDQDTRTPAATIEEAHGCGTALQEATDEQTPT